MDKQRTRYLVAYDISDAARRRRICLCLTGYKVGGQKSVIEIWVTEAELREIRGELERLMAVDEDSVYIFALDQRMQPRCKGLAHSVEQKFFSIV